MKIASIDKHPIIRKGLSLFLKDQFENAILLESESYASFEKLHESQNPDLIILGLEEKSCLSESQAVKKFKEKMPHIPVIVYDGEPRYDMAMTCIAEGANGYLVKNRSLEELIACIQSVLVGKQYINDDLTSLLLQQSIVAANEKSCISSLSKEELRTAKLMSTGVTSLEIASITNRTISTINRQKLSVYKKLNVTNVVELSKVVFP